jgi:hypothetical protein
MERAVKDDPVQFLLDGTPELPRIIPDPVDTDVYFPTDGLARTGQRKRDNIRIKVMVKKLPVDFQQALVGTKDIA